MAKREGNQVAEFPGFIQESLSFSFMISPVSKQARDSVGSFARVTGAGSRHSPKERDFKVEGKVKCQENHNSQRLTQKEEHN